MPALPDGTMALADELAMLTDFQPVTLKVLRWEERDKRLNIKDAELVA
jgi:hypothetical protein